MPNQPMVRYGQNNSLGGVQVGTSGTTYGSGGGTTTTTTTGSGGGTTFNYDPRIGNSALPAGIQGTANRAYTRDVQGNELAQNQINQITSQNSPLMRNAQMRGTRMANSRGMINSSMAGEAAQNAVIESAMPLALQDARAYQEAAGQNLQYLNQRDIANMNDQTNREAAWSASAAAQLQAESALQRQRENLAYEGEQAELQRRYGFQMAGLENQFGQERDWRQAGINEQSDWRGYQIESMGANQRFNYDMAARQWESQNQMRQMAYQGIFEQNLQNPQEFDEYINSGMMEYWLGSGPGSANNYFNVGFQRIYGG